MKKLFMMFATSAMICMVACSGDKSQTSATQEAPATEPVVEALSPAEANSKAGKEYIANLMKADSTVMVTPSGLAYKVIEPGKGDSPKATSDVKVKYVGTHINGQEFDNSHDEAISFNLQQVIPGFTEGLMLMNKGAKYELYIPGELAYGERGIPQAGIAPNELLIFQIELVDFQ